MIVFTLPGDYSHGEVNYFVNALTLDRRGGGPSRQTISDVWKDEGLDQSFGGGTGENMLQLVDGDERAKATLRDIARLLIPAQILV